MDLTDEYINVFSTNHTCVKRSTCSTRLGDYWSASSWSEDWTGRQQKTDRKALFSRMLDVNCDLAVTGWAGEQSSACVFACLSFQQF